VTAISTQATLEVDASRLSVRCCERGCREEDDAKWFTGATTGAHGQKIRENRLLCRRFSPNKRCFLNRVRKFDSCRGHPHEQAKSPA